MDSDGCCRVVGLNNALYGHCRPVVTAQLQHYKIIRPYLGKMSCQLQWLKPLWSFLVGQGRRKLGPTVGEEEKKKIQYKEHGRSVSVCQSLISPNFLMNTFFSIHLLDKLSPTAVSTCISLFNSQSPFPLSSQVSTHKRLTLVVFPRNCL